MAARRLIQGQRGIDTMEMEWSSGGGIVEILGSTVMVASGGKWVGRREMACRESIYRGWEREGYILFLQERPLIAPAGFKRHELYVPKLTTQVK